MCSMLSRSYRDHPIRHAAGTGSLDPQCPLVRKQMCARICARDAPACGETGETPRPLRGHAPPVSQVTAATGDQTRRRRCTSYGS